MHPPPRPVRWVAMRGLAVLFADCLPTADRQSIEIHEPGPSVDVHSDPPPSASNVGSPACSPRSR